MSIEHSPSRQRFLSRKQAAEYLGVVSEATLSKLAVLGGGPKFYKLGRRVGYTIEDPEAYAHARTSTSDGAEAA